ncbi:POK9 protein, partial [Mionectes macconnelli]|nr:POK9 protein [Mionectes macconnelli]
RGSLGLDVAAAIDVTLTDTTVHSIPTGINGPLTEDNNNIGALLIGRSSAGLKGLIVLPGVIDADYTGEIKVVAFTLCPPLVINKGTRMAQLMLYEHHPTGNEHSLPPRGNQGFGFTGDRVASLVQRMQKRPMITVKLTCNNYSCSITAMLDTGADVTIFA